MINFLLTWPNPKLLKFQMINRKMCVSRLIVKCQRTINFEINSCAIVIFHHLQKSFLKVELPVSADLYHCL